MELSVKMIGAEKNDVLPYPKYNCSGYWYIENINSNPEPESKVVFGMITDGGGPTRAIKLRPGLINGRMELQHYSGGELYEYLTYWRTPHSTPYDVVGGDVLAKNPIYIHQWERSDITFSFAAKAARTGARLKLNAIINWFDIMTPHQIGSYEQNFNNPRDVAIWNNDAYFVDRNSIYKIDISDKENPILMWIHALNLPNDAANRIDLILDGESNGAVKYVVTACGSNGLYLTDVETFVDYTCPVTDAQDVNVFQNHVYVANGQGGFAIVNINDPTNPFVEGSCSLTGDAVGIDLLIASDNTPHFAYIACSGMGMAVVNVQIPSQPQLVDRMTPSLDYSWAVDVNGQYVYLADGEGGLRIFNIEDPVYPDEKGRVAPSGSGSFRDVEVLEDHAFAADYSGKLSVINIQDKLNPSLISNCETTGSPWGVKIEPNFAYIADGGTVGSGLKIIDISTIFTIYQENTIRITNAWKTYTFILNDQNPPYIRYPVKDMQIRLGYVSQEGGELVDYDGVWLDNFKLYDELDWERPTEGPKKIQITDDGYIELADTLFFPRILWLEHPTFMDDSYLEKIDITKNLGFNAFYAAHTGIVKWGYGTKRELLRILDYAWSKGLMVLVHHPVYPVYNNDLGNLWSRYEEYVKDWAKFFAPHPALLGWLIADEYGGNNLVNGCRTFNAQVSLWIHEAEAGIPGFGFTLFHPTMVTTSEQPFSKLYDWQHPTTEQSPGGDIHSLIDHFWEGDNQYYIADIIAPDYYPIQGSVQVPQNILSDITEWTCTCRSRHQLDFKSKGLSPRNFVALPFIQMDPENGIVPPIGAVPAMAIQTMFKGSGGVMFYRSTNVARSWDIFDAESMQQWNESSQGRSGWLLNNLPDINRKINKYFFKLRENRTVAGSGITKDNLYLNMTQAARESKIDDTFISTNNQSWNFGANIALKCGQTTAWDGNKQNRIFIRFKDLPNYSGKNIIRANLRLYYINWDFNVDPKDSTPGPLRMFVGKLCNNYSQYYEWFEGLKEAYQGDEWELTWNWAGQYYYYCLDGARILPWSDLFTCARIPENHEDDLVSVIGLYTEIPLDPSLLDEWMSYTHPEDNEGILLQPSIWEGQNEYTNEFSSSDYERAEYSPQLEVFWTSNESYPDHVPFKYFEYSNVDYVETKVLIDRYEDLESGRLYAILGALNTINGDQCLRLYSKQIQVGDYVYKVNEDMEILDSYRITRGRNFNYLPFPEGSASKICETVEVDPEIPYCDGWNMFQAHLNDDPDTPQFEVCMFMIPLAD